MGGEFANAGMEVHTISKDITLFSQMLKQTGRTLQAPDSVHTPEAEQAALQIKDESELVFGEIKRMMEACGIKQKDGLIRPTTLQKFKWCFKKHKMVYLMAQLETLKLNLLVILQILSLGKMMAAVPSRYALHSPSQETRRVLRYGLVCLPKRSHSAPKKFNKSERKPKMLLSSGIGK